MEVKRLRPGAILPKRGSKLAVGYDIAACIDEPITIVSGARKLIKTGLAITEPEGTYGRLAPRSGLSWKKKIDLGAGVLDRDYTGEVHVLVVNNGDEDFIVNHGDRIAQLILEKAAIVPVVEVEELTETVRGSNGFGSTGVASEKEKEKLV